MFIKGIEGIGFKPAHVDPTVTNPGLAISKPPSFNPFAKGENYSSHSAVNAKDLAISNVSVPPTTSVVDEIPSPKESSNPLAKLNKKTEVESTVTWPRVVPRFQTAPASNQNSAIESRDLKVGNVVDA